MTSVHGELLEPWVVLVGKLDETSSMVSIMRGARRVRYALSPREPFEYFSRPRGWAEADAFLAEHPLGGCSSVSDVLEKQPGLLCAFSGDFVQDAWWLQGRCVVGDVVDPVGKNWDMVVQTCYSESGASCQAFQTTARLLSQYPRLSSDLIDNLEGVSYQGDDGGQYTHNPLDYARDLLYDLRTLLESGVAYLDLV